MLRPYVKITIQQTKPYTYKDESGVTQTIERNKKILLDFVETYEIESGWEDHTNKCTITLPKNIIVGVPQNTGLFGDSGVHNLILGGAYNINFDSSINTYAPVFMRGDIISIEDGYYFKNELGVDAKTGQNVFDGYISKVYSEIPIKIECEDHFYLLKRIPFDRATWDTELVSLCEHILKLVNAEFHDKNPFYNKLSFFTPDKITANFQLGHLDIGNMTCSQLLGRLKSQYHLDSTFKGDILQFGFPIYNEDTANQTAVFEFQNNIFDDSGLEYSNKEDVILSTVVSCSNITKTGKITKEGKESTKKVTKKVLVYWDIPTESFKYIVKKAGEPIPENEGGERHECLYAVDLTKPAPSDQELADYGISQLKKYYYLGFRGSFKTIGFPYVSWNDNILILDKVFSDRNGIYKVKKVIRTGGEGIEQEIFLDFKHQVPIPKISRKVYMI